EYRTLYIQNLFQRYLGFAANQSALSYFRPKFDLETTEQIRAEILGSPAFFAANGSNNATWLGAVFKDVLGRTLDSFSLNYWGTKLATQSRQSVALQILQSS